MKHDAGSEPWEQQDGESPLWYGRFQTFYLAVGPGRSIDDAWRRHQASRSKAATRSQRAAGSWFDAAAKHQWYQRAVAWDAHQHKLIRQALISDSIEAHRRHAMVVRAHFNRVAIQGEKVNYGQLSDPVRWVQTFERILDLERRVHMDPVHAFALEEADKHVNQVAREAESQDASEAQWDVTPEDLVAVSVIWSQLGITCESVGPEPPASASASHRSSNSGDPDWTMLPL
jgi:hypothetical protein